MSNQDAVVIVKGYADIIASMAGHQVSEEAIYVVWDGLLDLAKSLTEEQPKDGLSEF